MWLIIGGCVHVFQRKGKGGKPPAKKKQKIETESVDNSSNNEGEEKEEELVSFCRTKKETLSF